jgi:hypothetical protein
LVAAALVLAFAAGALVVFIAGPSSSNRSLSPAALPADPDQNVLAGLVVQPSDVAPPQTVALLQGGDQVTGETTLDLCNGAYPSESLRSARLQVAEGDSDGTVVLSTEAVLYRSLANTTQAFAELRKAAAACPQTPVPSPTGGPTVQTTFNPQPDGAWPQTPSVERVAYDFVMADDQGQTRHSVAVYLRRGRAFLGVYFSQADGAQAPVDGKTSMPDIVAVFASRLARLPDATVNRTVPGVSLSSFPSATG